MGKATGFMDYDRRDAECESPKERIKHFRNSTRLMSKKSRNTGARCMACGVPFWPGGTDDRRMASGCPLHNLVAGVE